MLSFTDGNSPKLSTHVLRRACWCSAAMSVCRTCKCSMPSYMSPSRAASGGAYRNGSANWHTVYTRMNRWAKNGVLDRVFAHLQREQLLRIRLEAVSLDSTIVKVHPDGTGALKKRPQAIGKSRGGWTTKLHLVAANERTALRFSLSPGQAHDAPEGASCSSAYEGQATRHLAVALGFTPVVPPRQNRRAPWAYDRQLYKRRNEVERLFRRLKGFRRIFTRFEKLDVLFLGFIVFALIVEALR